MVIDGADECDVIQQMVMVVMRMATLKEKYFMTIVD